MSEIKQLHQFAQTALNRKQFPQAQQALIKLLNIQPDFYDAYFLLGIMEAEFGQFTKAAALIEKAVALHKTAEYYAHLAKCYAMLGETVKTHRAVASAEAMNISSALTLDTLGVALSRLNEHDKAIDYFQQAIDKKQTAAFYYNLGSSQTFSGLFEKARASYEMAIKLEPLFYQAHSSLSHLGEISLAQNHIERLKQVYQEMPHPDAKLHISHALAKELETLGEYEACFTYLEQAKAEKRAHIEYQFSRDLALFEQLKSIFSDFHFSNINNDLENAQAIFVTGMPRSGTTLVERVLTNSTGVKSAGELQDFGLTLKKLSNTQSRFILDKETLVASEKIDFKKLGESYIECVEPMLEEGQRFVDKTPLNVLYAGHIVKAMPNAKILCVIRNPMDTIWGNYKQMFSLNDPYYQYAFDQQTIAQFYLQFVQLAEFWQELYPDNFKIVKYDEFVSEPLAIGQEFVEFCQIPWCESLLDITRNKSAVATASSVQVRSAINTKSLGQWKNLKSQLQPAFEIIERAGLLNSSD